MWFPLALTAMLMLVVRRSSEKTLTGRIPAASMAWLQQTFALPFIALALLLPMAGFYNPAELSAQFYWVIATYTVLTTLDVILYFKALSIGDISAISGALSLVVVSTLIGAYFLLGQVPSTMGIIGSVCILAGAYLASKRPAPADTIKTAANKLALILILIVVVLRGVHSPLEVVAIRETDPFYFNLITSLLGVPVILLVMYIRGRRTGQPALSKRLAQSINTHRLGLLLIGVTYAINLSCTFSAKLIADNAAYVTTIKSTSVLPMMILGVFLFKEKVSLRQWIGLGIIMVGLVFFSRA